MRIQILAAQKPNGDLVEPFDFCGLTIRSVGLHTVFMNGINFDVWVMSNQWEDEWEAANDKLLAANNELKETNVKLGQELQATVMTLDDKLQFEKKAVQSLKTQLTKSERQLEELKAVNANWEKIAAKLEKEFQASSMRLVDQLKSEKKAVESLKTQLTESRRQQQSDVDAMRFANNELKSSHRLQVIKVLKMATEMATELLRTV